MSALMHWNTYRRLLCVEFSRQEKFELVFSEKANFSNRRLASLLGVAKSEYCVWKKRQQKVTSKKARAERSLNAKIHELGSTPCCRLILG